MSQATKQITEQPETNNKVMKNNDLKAGNISDFEPTFSEERINLNQMPPPMQSDDNLVPKKTFRRVPGIW